MMFLLPLINPGKFDIVSINRSVIKRRQVRESQPGGRGTVRMRGTKVRKSPGVLPVFAWCLPFLEAGGWCFFFTGCGSQRWNICLLSSAWRTSVFRFCILKRSSGKVLSILQRFIYLLRKMKRNRNILQQFNHLYLDDQGNTANIAERVPTPVLKFAPRGHNLFI